MVRRAVAILDEAKRRSAGLTARAYKLAPWLATDRADESRPASPDESRRP